MYRPSFILCPLLLVVLISGLGINTQPAEAQQTVTLSGQITDVAGQPVPGASVSLHRLPDHTYIDSQDTDANGDYRLSVASGTYNLTVNPPYGPFIAQRHELRLSTDTTHNIVLETGVTLSGQVSGPDGQPVSSWVYLSVRNEAGQEISFGGQTMAPTA